MYDAKNYGPALRAFEESADAGPKADFAEHGIADRREIVHQARLMAYRREPAMVELEDDMRGQ